MKKIIRMRMTPNKCKELTGESVKADLAIREVEVDLDSMTPAARFIAEHITATYVKDEYLDKIDVTAVSGMTMEQRDREAGQPEEYIRKMSKAYEGIYTNDHMKASVTFPIYGGKHARPEDVIEDAASECRRAGAVRLVAKSGEIFEY